MNARSTVEALRLSRHADHLEAKLTDLLTSTLAGDEEVEQARKRLEKAGNAFDQARSEFRKVQEAKTTQFREANKDRLATIRKMRERAEKSTVPEWADAFITRLCNGVDWGPRGWIYVWGNGRHIILRNPGAKFWADRLTGSKYGETKTYLFDTRVKGQGISLTWDGNYVAVHRGRLPRSVFEKWKAMAEGAK